jgi:hypothetical protein
MDPFDPNFPSQPPPKHFSLPPKPRISTLGMAVGILIILGLLIGGGFAVYTLMPKNAVQPEVVKTPVPPPNATPIEVPKLKPKALPSSQTVEPSIIASTDPTTDAWEHLQETYRTASPELAIVALQDFVQNSPKSNFVATAQSQIDEALDRLWWMRIKSLCEDRDRLAKQMTRIDEQIAVVKSNGPVAERIAELQGERDPIAKQLEAVQGQLDEMKYKDSRVPDLYHEAQLAQLRKARDSQAYESWKKSTSIYIKRNRGRLPW